MRRHSHGVLEPLRQIEDEIVCGLRRGRKRVFGALALLLGNLPLLDGNAALPIGEARERKSDNEAGSKAASEDIAPPGRPAPAPGDECLGLFGRLRCAARARRDPALGLFQRRRAQQQPARLPRRRPAARRLAEFGVLPDPADVGSQRFGELIGARLKAMPGRQRK